ncbi:MAG: non-canonical purine NTP pyrophosphatase [Firmicutes bacterium HGW-Firmicutes-7]|nr:MAG: non-canonical purine NTP pyrophosphatase [Firmicutes bacterium HGW-Firmicutes-7]
MKSKPILFATKNKNKMKEINAILGTVGIEVLSMEEIGIDVDVEEDGLTFEENAIKKAEEIMKLTQSIVLADDSGLEVDYLNKEPGIYSARYGGLETPYKIKNKLIIDRLEGVLEPERTARFVCAIAAAFPDGRTITTRGTVEGTIAFEEKGENGFGYDPILYVPEYKMTTGQMSSDLKNCISHRGKALRAMREILEEYYARKSSI